MFAWMNAEALALTIETRVGAFLEPVTLRLWKKGEESGNVLAVVEMRTDCDQDAVWLKVRVQGAGPACHTGHRTASTAVSRSGRPRVARAVDRLESQAGVPKALDPAQVYRPGTG